MNARVQRVMFSLALLYWGGVLVYFYSNGRILKYLAPDFRPLALVGGLGLLIVGLFNLLTSGEKASCGHDHGPDDDHDHESLDVHPIAAFLILVVPLLLAVGWTKDAYSPGALARKGLFDSPMESELFRSSMLPALTRELIESQHPKNSDGYHPFPLMELFFSSGDPEMRDLVEGMPVVTEGRLVDDPEGPANQRRLYRLFITCCAADSRAIPIIVRFKGEVPTVEENTWMTLSGTMRFPDEGQGFLPVLEVDHAKESPPPPEESFMRGF